MNFGSAGSSLIAHCTNCRINELGQTIQAFADAGIAYDLLASAFRSSQHPDGMTPIEELRIRDGLAEVAKTILQHRDNWSFTHGSGDTHWAHGYELAIASIALAMPSYKTAYFGVSGADRATINDLYDERMEYWNPMPHQGITWYDAATNPAVDTPGFPNNKAALRSEFQISDDGYWTGPNDLQGDGERYVVGPLGNRLVDVKSGGLANAENRVELVEMDGYESPFVGRIFAVNYMRSIKGDSNQHAVRTYIRRYLLSGLRSLSWDGTLKRYSTNPVRFAPFVTAFNPQYDFAGSASARALASEFLTYLNRYYGFESGSYPSYIENDRKVLYGPYALALFADTSQVPAATLSNLHAPIIKPTFKYVVMPGESLYKQILAMDPDDQNISITVNNLPSGASYDSNTNIVTWTPGAGDAGVHIVTIAASDGTFITTRPFPIIVKPNAGSGPVPAGPSNVQVSVDSQRVATLTWSAPQGVSVSAFVIYRDGSLHDVVTAPALVYVDREPLPAGSHTRYEVALYDVNGGESFASQASPPIVSLAPSAP